MQPNTHRKPEIKIRSFLAIILVPLLIVIPTAVYLAVSGVQRDLRTIADAYTHRIDEVITELRDENRRAIQHADRCEAIREELLFESILRELIIVKNGVAVCSSKRGEIDHNLTDFIHRDGVTSGEYLIDLSKDPAQRTLIVVDTLPGDKFSGAFSIVERGYLVDRIGRVENDKLSYIRARFGERTYPAGQSFHSESLHLIYPSKQYDYSLLVEAKREFILRELLYFIASGIPVSLMISALFLVTTRYLRNRESLLDDLKKGLKRSELFLVYQPIIDASQNKVTKLEALVRWKHPTLGLIGPDTFISIAEYHNLVDEITDFALERALTELTELPLSKGIQVAINIPPSYLHNPDNIDALIYYNSEFKQQGYELCVEITERQMLDELSRNEVNNLHHQGLSIAIDDFGTGHTSLSVLKDIRFSFLKIDKCFIDTIGIDTVNAMVLTTIIDLGHKLGVRLIAEGIETQAQADYLKAQKVHFLQGFYFAKPIAAPELSACITDIDQRT
ncbi:MULTISPECIES: EAL domain-containing protein [Vibrio]|uniref:cyclic-guanylate-specific phosphodiesterase n=1 Tax=Vibrio proteolyticus NBRC 13287 TaxID=1219065 RepID=U3BCT3_VIBPR|nr:MULTISPECIES: EAL domain-containing protein [Vibrio]NAX20795.1 EAL domain-containing protein [Vibrio sp. V39_P1S14PM300]GAD67579.1 hypothetical protein VPR01S_08_01620 [Vibrio proteolyticus NBRC 13287]